MFYDLLLCGSHGGEPCAVGGGFARWRCGRVVAHWSHSAGAGRAAVLQGL